MEDPANLWWKGRGGPSWFTEYNVLTGLSARSYGRFATSVTRIAAGRVTRGLPSALASVWLQNLQPLSILRRVFGFTRFQTTAGVERYLDMTDLGARGFEPDSFYFNQATNIIARERRQGPLFLFVYTAANHFPWEFGFRPDLTRIGVDLGQQREHR